MDKCYKYEFEWEKNKWQIDMNVIMPFILFFSCIVYGYIQTILIWGTHIGSKKLNYA